MENNSLTIDGIVYYSKDFFKENIKKSIETFFKSVTVDKSSSIIIVTVLKEFAVTKRTDKSEMLVDLEEEMSKRCRGARGKRKRDILETLKNLYENLNDKDINKLRGCIFEKVIEEYISSRPVIFGAGIVDGKSEEELKKIDPKDIPMVKNYCLKKTKECNDFREQYMIEKGITTLNFEDMIEIEERLRKLGDKKNTRETCDAIFKHEGKLHLVEMKLNPISFDCFSLSTLATMGEYLDSKGVENFELVCISTWRDNKAESTFKIEINECENECLSQKLEKQKTNIEKRFVVIGFQEMIDIIERLDRKTA